MTVHLCTLAEAGGSANPKWIKNNLENTFLIGYVLCKEKLIACSVLKNFRHEYIEIIKEEADFTLKKIK